MALRVIGCGDFHLIAFLLQSAYVLSIRPGLHARRCCACLEGVCDKIKALVQECADLRVLCSDQSERGCFLVFCHTCPLKEAAITRRYAGMIPQARALVPFASQRIVPSICMACQNDIALSG
jgi:hypothetical protein